MTELTEHGKAALKGCVNLLVGYRHMGLSKEYHAVGQMLIIKCESHTPNGEGNDYRECDIADVANNPKFSFDHVGVVCAWFWPDAALSGIAT